MMLIITRLSGLFVTAPFFSRATGPARIRALLILAIALVIFPLVSPWKHEADTLHASLVGAAISEFFVGALLGLFVHWVFSAIQLAGMIMGFEMGLSMAQVMDPTSGAQVGIIGNTLYLASLILFLTIDGHHLLLEGLTGSFHTVPLGGGSALLVGDVVLNAGVEALLRLFKLAVLIAAPVIVTSKMLYLGMGLINRASPQIQVFFLAMPIAQMAGLVIIGLTMALFGQVLIRELNAFIRLTFNLLGIS